MFKIYSSHSVLNPLVINVSWFPPPTSLTSSPTMHSLRSFFFFNYMEPYFYKHIKHALSLGPCYLLFPLHKMLPQISEQSVPQISFRSLCSNVIIMQGHYSMGSPHPTPGHWKLHENKGLVYFIQCFMFGAWNNAWHTVKVKSLSCVQLFATPWTTAYQVPPSMGLNRQEYWSGLPFPSPGDLPNPGIEPGSHIVGRCFTVWATREVRHTVITNRYLWKK